ncbi:helix-turn-helix domain-containing protein [Bacillus cereus group sp. MYBK30-1]|uniref:helix-turn-helix domain-containing protein n=1 Tax=unclassified Bacillus cereus group TaxID=2750818 RepID=UPI003F7B1D0C
MKLNYRFEIHPTEEQQHTLERWISICRQQYNSALLDKQRYYKQNKKDLTRYELQDQQKLDKKIYHFLKDLFRKCLRAWKKPIKSSLKRMLAIQKGKVLKNIVLLLLLNLVCSNIKRSSFFLKMYIDAKYIMNIRKEFYISLIYSFPSTLIIYCNSFHV